MKFNIQTKLLLSHLSAVSKVLKSKNTISVFDNFLFNLEGNTLIITGSDSENTLVARTEVTSAEGSGKFTVNAKKIVELLKGLPDQGLQFEINDENVEINIYYMNGKFNFIGGTGAEFPIPTRDTAQSEQFELPAAEVVESINRTIFAVGTDDLRPQMMGVLWDIKPDEIVFVASDTHKLVRYRNMRLVTGKELSFILPAGPAAIIGSLFDRREDNVAITIDPKGATFENDEYTITCNFVLGRFPNYNSVIPTQSPYNLTIDRVSLLNAIRRVAVFAGAGGLIVLELDNEQVQLKTQNVDYSTSAEEKVACSYDGERMVMGYNHERLEEVLANIEGDTVNVHLSDPTRAGIFVPSEQKEGEDLLVLIMPMMVSEGY